MAELNAPGMRGSGFAGDHSQMLLIALGIGVLLGSTWATRSQTLFGSPLFLSYTSLIWIAAAIAFAVIFRNGLPAPKSQCVLVAILFGLHLLAVFATLFLATPSELAALGAISSLFEGAGIALTIIVFLAKLSRLCIRDIAISIALAFLVANLYDAVFINMSAAVTVQWVAGKFVVMLVLASVLLRQTKNMDTEKMPVSHDDAAASEMLDEASLPHPALPFLVFVAVFMFIAGIFANITGLGGVGAKAFFGVSDAILVIGVRLLLLLFCAALARAMRPIVAVEICTAIWTAGLLLVIFLWGSDSASIGALAIEAGLYILQVMSLVIAVQFAHAHASFTVLAIGMMTAAESFNQITRFFSSFLLAGPDTPYQTVVILDLASLAVIICVLAVGLLLASRAVRQVESMSSSLKAANESPQTAGAPIEDDPIMNAERDFGRKFKGFCDDKQLTEREREVLFEAVHGYTLESIADKLCLSRETVKTYLSRSYNRAGVNSKQAMLSLIDSYDARSSQKAAASSR